jgi:hypothetical protein
MEKTKKQDTFFALTIPLTHKLQTTTANKQQVPRNGFKHQEVRAAGQYHRYPVSSVSFGSRQ